MIVTCSCQHCNGQIEFDAEHFLEETSSVPCPHCSFETKLYIPGGQFPAQAGPAPEVLDVDTEDHASDAFLIELRLNSGAEFRVKAIKLYDEFALAQLNSKKAEAMKLLQGVSTGLGTIGSIEWVLAASVVIGAAEAAPLSRSVDRWL